MTSIELATALPETMEGAPAHHYMLGPESSTMLGVADGATGSAAIETFADEFVVPDTPSELDIYAEKGSETEEIEPIKPKRKNEPRPGYYRKNNQQDSTNEGWEEQAACRGVDPETFFDAITTQKGGAQQSAVKAAKKVCRSCVVRPECLEWAFQQGEEYGFWGGMSESERKEIKKLSKKAYRRHVQLARDEVEQLIVSQQQQREPNDHHQPVE